MWMSSAKPLPKCKILVQVKCLDFLRKSNLAQWIFIPTKLIFYVHATVLPHHLNKFWTSRANLSEYYLDVFLSCFLSVLSQYHFNLFEPISFRFIQILFEFFLANFFFRVIGILFGCFLSNFFRFIGLLLFRCLFSHFFQIYLNIIWFFLANFFFRFIRILFGWFLRRPEKWNFPTLRLRILASGNWG